MSDVGHAQRQKLFRAAAHDLAKPPVDEKEAAVQFALQDPGPALLEDAGEPLLAGAERLLGPDPVRGFDDGDEHAADTAWSGIVRDRTVAQGKARIFPFGKAAPLYLDQQVLGEVCAAGPVQYRLMQRPQLILHFGPRFVKGQPERVRMPGAEDRAIAVVVNHHQLGPPAHAHGKARSEHHADNKLQAGRPVLPGTERCFRPIRGLQTRRHLRHAGQVETRRMGRHPDTLKPDWTLISYRKGILNGTDPPPECLSSNNYVKRHRFPGTEKKYAMERYCGLVACAEEHRHRRTPLHRHGRTCSGHPRLSAARIKMRMRGHDGLNAEHTP